MKKIIVLLFLFMFLVGCNMSNTPSSKVEEYLNNFNNLSDEVVSDIEVKISNENLSSENKALYKKALFHEHENMKYEIKDESINGDKASVVVKITVLDYYKASKDSLDYMQEHTEEFSDVNGMFDNELFNTYRLNQMDNAKDTIDYEITFYLNKKDSQWVLDNPDSDVIEKLNGFYNYN